MAKRNHNPFLKDNSNIQWKHKKFDYTANVLTYLGKTLIHKASTSEGELWWIFKVNWTGVDMTDVEGPLVGNWDDRTTLDWE